MIVREKLSLENGREGFFFYYSYPGVLKGVTPSLFIYIYNFNEINIIQSNKMHIIKCTHAHAGMRRGMCMSTYT